MKVYIVGKEAFVELPNSGYMLCIGTRESIDGASDKQLTEAVEKAIAIAQMRSIKNSHGHQVH